MYVYRVTFDSGDTYGYWFKDLCTLLYADHAKARVYMQRGKAWDVIFPNIRGTNIIIEKVRVPSRAWARKQKLVEN